MKEISHKFANDEINLLAKTKENNTDAHYARKFLTIQTYKRIL